MADTGRRTAQIHHNPLCSFVSSWKEIFESLVTDFSPAYQLFLMILVPSAVLVPLPYLSASLENELSASSGTQWGIFTSIWIHSGLAHFVNNMLGLLVYLLLFVIVNRDFPQEEKTRRAVVLRWMVFPAAMIANLFTIILLPERAVGSSGVVLASEGVAVAYALLNALPPRLGASELRRHFFDPNKRQRTLLGLIVFVTFYGWFLLLPQQFFFAGPGVNVLAHFVGFYSAFLGVLTFELLRPFSRVRALKKPRDYFRSEYNAL